MRANTKTTLLHINRSNGPGRLIVRFFQSVATRTTPRIIRRILLAVILAAALFVGLPYLIITNSTIPHIYPVDSVPTAQVAIVFGAGLQRDGTPTPVLRDRVETAVDLYFAGKVRKLLMSGDNRFVEYNEPGSMRQYAIDLGVPERDIVLDYAGRRTYDTCYRARHIFGVRDAILVTQRYHLYRALYTCNNLGVASSGVSADRREYRKSSLFRWGSRELLALPVALWEVWVARPLPVLGQPEPIF